MPPVTQSRCSPRRLLPLRSSPRHGSFHVDTTLTIFDGPLLRLVVAFRSDGTWVFADHRIGAWAIIKEGGAAEVRRSIASAFAFARSYGLAFRPTRRNRGAPFVPPVLSYAARDSDVAEAVLAVLPAAVLRWLGRADGSTVHVRGDPVVSFDHDTGPWDGDGSVWRGVIRSPHSIWCTASLWTTACLRTHAVSHRTIEARTMPPR